MLNNVLVEDVRRTGLSYLQIAEALGVSLECLRKIRASCEGKYLAAILSLHRSHVRTGNSDWVTLFYHDLLLARSKGGQAFKEYDDRTRATIGHLLSSRDIAPIDLGVLAFILSHLQMSAWQSSRYQDNSLRASAVQSANLALKYIQGSNNAKLALFVRLEEKLKVNMVMVELNSTPPNLRRSDKYLRKRLLDMKTLEVLQHHALFTPSKEIDLPFLRNGLVVSELLGGELMFSNFEIFHCRLMALCQGWHDPHSQPAVFGSTPSLSKDPDLAAYREYYLLNPLSDI